MIQFPLNVQNRLELNMWNNRQRGPAAAAADDVSSDPKGKQD